MIIILFLKVRSKIPTAIWIIFTKTWGVLKIATSFYKLWSLSLFSREEECDAITLSSAEVTASRCSIRHLILHYFVFMSDCPLYQWVAKYNLHYAWYRIFPWICKERLLELHGIRDNIRKKIQESQTDNRDTSHYLKENPFHRLDMVNWDSSLGDCERHKISSTWGTTK